VIYCLSQHHTGTWTTLDWIQRHRGVDGIITAAHLFDAVERNGAGMMFQPIEGGPIPPRWDPSMVYHDHIETDGPEPTRINRTQVLIATVTPTVIPIRDPLASLVSYQNRIDTDQQPDHRDVGHFVDRWMRLAETALAIFKDYAHIRFVCWDLVGAMDKFEAFEYLAGISADLGLTDVRPSLECAKSMIRNNDLGDYPLKTAYLEGDLDFLEKNISGGGLLALMQNTDPLRPWLEGLGYRDLRWWS
jgi:hypothetical protein